jgi:hypothetical protein
LRGRRCLAATSSSPAPSCTGSRMRPSSLVTHALTPSPSPPPPSPPPC